MVKVRHTCLSFILHLGTPPRLQVVPYLNLVESRCNCNLCLSMIKAMKFFQLVHFSRFNILIQDLFCRCSQANHCPSIFCCRNYVSKFWISDSVNLWTSVSIFFSNFLVCLCRFLFFFSLSCSLSLSLLFFSFFGGYWMNFQETPFTLLLFINPSRESHISIIRFKGILHGHV